MTDNLTFHEKGNDNISKTIQFSEDVQYHLPFSFFSYICHISLCCLNEIPDGCRTINIFFIEEESLNSSG